MILEDFGCLLIDNLRSKAYLHKLIMNSFMPKFVVYLELQKYSKIKENPETLSVKDLVNSAYRKRKYFLYNPLLKNSSLLNCSKDKYTKYAFFNTEEPILDKIIKNKLNYRIVKASTVNDMEVINTLRKSSPTHFLFGGGGILRKPILSIGKRFLHIHPGIIPLFRGSHCIEWSILLGEKCVATAFLMNETIDGGEVITQMEFDFPELENGAIPPMYSPFIRSEVLIKVINDYIDKGRFIYRNSNLSNEQIYYKMHPAITNLVFHKLAKK